MIAMLKGAHEALGLAGVAAVLAAGNAAAAEPLPAWLTEAMAREAALPPAVDVAADDGWFQARVPGVAKPVAVREGGSYTLQMQLAGGVSMSFEVLPDPRDLAALLAETAEISFREIAKTNGEVQARVVDASDAGAVGEHPYLALRWVYRALQKGEQRVGGLQQLAADLGEAAIYCAHDELGYHQTFQAVARAVTSSLRVLGEPVAQVYFREISVVTLNGAKVGVATTRLVRDADGDTQVLNKSALLVQRAPGVLYAQDNVALEWVRPDGSMINASQVQAAEGRLTEDMALRPVEAGGWRASGRLSGKEVSFDIPDAPDSFLAQARARQRLMAKESPVGGSTEGRSWSSLDLGRLLTTRATVLAPAGPDAFAVREEMGSVALEAVLDRKTGTMRSARMPMGPLTLNFERILQQGSF